MKKGRALPIFNVTAKAVLQHVNGIKEEEITLTNTKTEGLTFFDIADIADKCYKGDLDSSTISELTEKKKFNPTKDQYCGIKAVCEVVNVMFNPVNLGVSSKFEQVFFDKENQVIRVRFASRGGTGTGSLYEYRAKEGSDPGNSMEVIISLLEQAFAMGQSVGALFSKLVEKNPLIEYELIEKGM